MQFLGGKFDWDKLLKAGWQRILMIKVKFKLGKFCTNKMHVESNIKLNTIY